MQETDTARHLQVCSIAPTLPPAIQWHMVDSVNCAIDNGDTVNLEPLVRALHDRFGEFLADWWAVLSV